MGNGKMLAPIKIINVDCIDHKIMKQVSLEVMLMQGKVLFSDKGEKLVFTLLNN